VLAHAIAYYSSYDVCLRGGTFVNIHFKGFVFLTQKILSMMNNEGGVVFINAAADCYNVPGYAIYASCRGAVATFARYEFGSRGIRANTVAPGGIETALGSYSDPEVPFEEVVVA
jgi:NAD(P)-dependent dehydrogenase (short-subunit alcohol dehydrogenase family)